MPRLKQTMIDISQVRWSIGQVAEMFCIQTSTLYFWETEFGRLSTRFGRLVVTHKGMGKERHYTAKDLQKIRTIYNLLYTEGFTITGAKKRMEEIKQKIF
jgi:DNA-binding transcriptional MerR regulator